MSENISGDFYGELSYLPITLFGEKLRVGVVGGGNGALIKTRNFYNKGASIEVIALEFIEEFKKFSSSKVTLTIGEYTEKFIKDKHIIVIAIDNEKIINEIIRHCKNNYKIFINSSNFKDGMGVIPVSRETDSISISVNTKKGNPKAAVMLADYCSNILKEFDSFVEFSSRIRNNINFEKEIKKSLISFINDEDFKLYYDRKKHMNILRLFYNEEVIEEINRLGMEEK